MPLWDFASTDGIKDSSAASCAASGLLELSTYLNSTNQTAAQYLFHFLYYHYYYQYYYQYYYHYYYRYYYHHIFIISSVFFFDNVKKVPGCCQQHFDQLEQSQLSLWSFVSSLLTFSRFLFPILSHLLSRLSLSFLSFFSVFSLVSLPFSRFLSCFSFSRACRCNFWFPKRQSEAILLKATGGQAQQMNSSLIFGDYYYIEALLKSLEINN